MKNRIIAIVCLLLCCVFVLSACQKPNEDVDPIVPDAPVKPRIPATDTNIVANGKTDYKIVVPSDIDANVSFAVSDLQGFVRESTGVEIPIVAGSTEELDPNAKVISVGNTNVFATSGLTITDDMKLTGYYIKRFGTTLVLNAKDGNGIASAIYAMLAATIDLEIYAYDEYALTKMTDMPLLDFDIKYIPDVDVRELLMKSLNSQYRLRMGYYNALGKGKWVLFGHTTTGATGGDANALLPYSVYGKEHKDWYNSAGTQLCYANEEMRQELVKQAKRKIAESPDAKYLMIGHEDNMDMCECDDCVAERNLYGGYGGQELNFTNKCAADLNAWMADAYPDRTMKYVFFAYQTSQEPPIKTETVGNKTAPVKTTEGEFVPYYSGFKVEKNVMVMYCPIDSDFRKGFSETENGAQYEQLNGWASLFRQAGATDSIICWAYSLAVRDYFMPLDNFGAYKEQYKFYIDCGVSYVMDQSYYDSAIPCFEALRIYTQAKLMYDNSLDYNELARDFIEHYYGEGAEAFKKYYNYFLVYYKYLEQTKGLNGSIWYNISGQADFWPTEVVDLMMSYLDEAIAAIEPLRTTNPERFAVLNDRLRRERLTPIFLMFQLHINEVPADKAAEYLADMKTYTKKYDITGSGESRFDMDTLIEKWTVALGLGGEQ